MIKIITGGFEETLKRITKIWIWTRLGYMDEQGNTKEHNKDHSKVIKFIALPKYGLGKELK